MDKLKEIFKKVVFYINKFIKIILPDGITSDPKSFLVFKTKGGIRVKRGRTVYLVINVAEQALIKMPDVTGMKYKEAVNIISNNVINSMTNVKILPKVEVSDDMYENNVVLSQIPSPEDVVGMNTEIILTVNNKPTQE